MKRVVQNNPIFNVDKKICIFWSAKSGSSTALKMFFDYIGYQCTQGFIHKDRIQDYSKNIQKTKKLPKDFDSYIKFQIVRNSYERAVSSYLHYDFHSSKMQEKYKQDTGIPYNNLSFIDFLTYIQNEIKCDHKINPHFEIQTQEITEHLVKNNLIVHLENFSNDIGRINDTYQTALDPKAYYAPHSHKKRYKIDSYISYYKDPLAKKIVEDIYESDIENFKFLPIL